MVFPRLSRRVRILTVAVLGLIVTAVPATASSGHFVYVDDWWQPGYNEAFVSEDHDMIWVGDHEADGDGVYAEYRGPNAVHGFVWDGNGSRDGYGYAEAPITSFRVCEDDWGWDDCSEWRYI